MYYTIKEKLLYLETSLRMILKEETEKEVKRKLSPKEKEDLIKTLTEQMKEAAKLLEFEHAAFLRDKISELKGENENKKIKF